MKKTLLFLVPAIAIALTGCFGNAEEEIPAKYFSERNELKGNPSKVIETTTDYREVAAGRPGVLYSKSITFYDGKDNITSYEYISHSDEQSGYKREFERDENGHIQKMTYTADTGDYTSEYTWKGKLITKIQHIQDGEPTSYYKYTYKGNKEISRGLFNSMGVKLNHTDYVWDGDRVVKHVDQDFEDDSVETYTISYPDDNTEVVTYESDGEEIYTVTITYNENGLFSSMVWEYPDEESNGRNYTYEYDSVGNWVKRTVTYLDGSLMWIDECEWTY